MILVKRLALWLSITVSRNYILIPISLCHTSIRVFWSDNLLPKSLALTPTAYFPTQLKQTLAALNHLTNNGVRSENIQIAGESAGGALILQLLSHMLHPLSNVPGFPDHMKLGRACIMSPWVSLTGNIGSHFENTDSDVLPAETWAYLGEQTLPSLSDVSGPFLQAIDASDDWFTGAEKRVKRLLLTVGEKECLRDDVLRESRRKFLAMAPF